MKSPTCFIVAPIGERYNHTKDFGGVDFIVSTSIEDHTVSNRMAEVIEVPIDYTGPIEIGDTLLVHHNVFKFYYDTSGVRRSGRSFLKGNVFLVDPDQFFMYKKNGQWTAHDRYCFVRPVGSDGNIGEGSSADSGLVGEMVYPSASLVRVGVTPGQKVVFTPHSQYQFEVDGETLYRVFDHQIAIKL